jgi:hypothetical protein
VDPAEATPPFAPRHDADEVIEVGNAYDDNNNAQDEQRKAPADKKEESAKKEKGKSGNFLVTAAAVLLMFGATVVVVGLMLMNSGTLPGIADLSSSSESKDETDAIAAVDEETETNAKVEVRTTRVETVVEPSEPVENIVEQAWYTPTQRPEAAIRTRPSQYTNPAPGGNHSKMVVEAARNGECSSALIRLESALLDSSDYAILYKKVWRCYTYSHQKPLKANLTSWKEMRTLIPHFQGNTTSDATKDVKKPYWYRPPTGGIEQRLEAWNRSSLGDGLMGDVVRDHFSQEVVATNLANDLLIEVSAALALSRVQNPPAEVIQWWSRRLYFAGKFWDRPAGQIVKLYQPAVVDSFEHMLNEASRGLLQHWEASKIVYDASRPDERWKEVVEARGLPLEVGEALLVAKGLIPPPDQRIHKPSAAELRERKRRKDALGTGAPTGELDLSIMNEPRTWNKHERSTQRE